MGGQNTCTKATKGKLKKKGQRLTELRMAKKADQQHKQQPGVLHYHRAQSKKYRSRNINGTNASFSHAGDIEEQQHNKSQLSADTASEETARQSMSREFAGTYMAHTYMYYCLWVYRIASLMHGQW